MRIVAGKFRGKNLSNSSNLESLRPTTDKNREALFNILSSAKFIKEIGFKIIGAEILDVCCGSGAVGFESLSRGAKSVTFIDNNNSHIKIAQKNAKILSVENEIEIRRCDAKELPENDKFFDLVFIDPPYAEDYKSIISSLLENNWIKKGSLIVVEFQTSNEPKDFILDELKLLESKRYGKTSFVFLSI